jgi:hypothetical protein
MIDLLYFSATKSIASRVFKRLGRHVNRNNDLTRAPLHFQMNVRTWRRRFDLFDEVLRIIDGAVALDNADDTIAVAQKTVCRKAGDASLNCRATGTIAANSRLAKAVTDRFRAQLNAKKSDGNQILRVWFFSQANLHEDFV